MPYDEEDAISEQRHQDWLSRHYDDILQTNRHPRKIMGFEERISSCISISTTLGAIAIDVMPSFAFLCQTS